MTTYISQRDRWVAIGQRVGRTALITFASFLTVSGGIENVDWIAAGSTTLLTALLAFLTASVTLPEHEGKPQSKWVAVLSRTWKTFAQTLIGAIGPAVLITDVSWTSALSIAAAAALGTALLAVVSFLPETAEVVTVIEEPEFEEPDDEEVEGDDELPEAESDEDPYELRYDYPDTAKG